ncbi:MAG: hypothetical protein H8E46_04780 [FCB group bacterium]|nr:hypothetical protein [FCB group bacterium]
MLGKLLLTIIIYFLISSVVKSIVRNMRGQRLNKNNSAEGGSNKKVDKSAAEDADFEVLDD